MITIVAVPPEWARTAATYNWPLFVKACSRGCDTAPETFVEWVAQEKAVLWLACLDNLPLGICITRKEQRADGVMTIFVSLVGGVKFREWISVLRNRIHQFKRDEGAAMLVWKGRKGWGRALGLTPLRQDELGYWHFEDYGT